MEKLFVLLKEDNTVNAVLGTEEELSSIWFFEDTMYTQRAEAAFGEDLFNYEGYYFHNGFFEPIPEEGVIDESDSQAE